MAGVNLQFKVVGTPGKRRIDRAIRNASDLSPVFNGEVDAVIRDFFKRQFETSGVAGGKPWRSLTPDTIAIKRKFHRAYMGILRSSNRLYKSYVSRTGPDTHLRITKDSYTRGTLVPYAKFHQTGFRQTVIFGSPRRRPIKVPARQVIVTPLPRLVWTKVRNAVNAHMSRGT